MPTLDKRLLVREENIAIVRREFYLRAETAETKQPILWIDHPHYGNILCSHYYENGMEVAQKEFGLDINVAEIVHHYRNLYPSGVSQVIHFDMAVLTMYKNRPKAAWRELAVMTETKGMMVEGWGERDLPDQAGRSAILNAWGPTLEWPSELLDFKIRPCITEFALDINRLFSWHKEIVNRFLIKGEDYEEYI